MSRTRVVVTGMGTTSPLGGDVPTTWEGMLEGRSGVRRLTEDWVEELPVKIAARVAVEPTEVLERVKARRLDRTSQFAMVAAMEAWRDAGLEEPHQAGELDGDRIGVAMATGIGGGETPPGHNNTPKGKGPPRGPPPPGPPLTPLPPRPPIT